MKKITCEPKTTNSLYDDLLAPEGIAGPDGMPTEEFIRLMNKGLLKIMVEKAVTEGLTWRERRDVNRLLKELSRK